MQCPILYKDGNVTGEATFVYQPLPGLDMGIPISAKKVTHNEQTSVLFKLAGHLWALVGMNRKTNTLTMFLVDAAKVTVDGVMMPPDRVISKANTLKQTVDQLRPGIVKSWVWEHTRWTPFKLPR
jgi:hypothetical protein